MADQDDQQPAAAKTKPARSRKPAAPKAAQQLQSKDDIELQIAQTRLKRETLDLEAAQEDNDRRVQTKAQRARANRQRQQDLANEVAGRKAATRQCTHRQGGSPGALNKGKGPTALNVAKMPDGFTKLIMCGICRLRRVNPHPADKSKKIRAGETAAMRDARVLKFETDQAEFDRLYELSRDGLTPESVQEMDCGVTLMSTDEDGIPLLKPRPFDTNPLYM